MSSAAVKTTRKPRRTTPAQFRDACNRLAKTPLQLARAECANHRSGGSCLSHRLAADKPPARCVLAEPGKACQYFEHAVAPLAESRPGYAKAVEEYYAGLLPEDASVKVIPGGWTCDCGNRMFKGRRMCDACARKNSLAAKKRWKAKRSRPTVDS